MQKFSDHFTQVKTEKSLIESLNRSTKLNLMLESKLAEFGVRSIVDLNETQLAEYTAYAKALKNAPLNEGSKIESEKEFREYATKVLKEMHGKDFDENIAKKVIDGIIKDVDGDWGEAIGKLTAK